MRFDTNDGRVEKEFFDGFARVARIVISANNYDDILGKKRIDLKLHHEIKEYIDKGSFKSALIALCASARNKKLSYHSVPENSSIIYYGGTKNNLRELCFFRSLMWFAPDLSIHELSDSEYDSLVPFSPEISPEIQGELLRILKGYDFNLSLVRQLRLYLAAFLSFSSTILNSKARLRGLVVANDHSPKQVALSKVCKLAGISRLYLQHAEITENFPPLDFEYALLHNRKSLDTYMAIGASNCEVGIFPRGKALDINEWAKSIGGLIGTKSACVAVYTSSVFDEDYLKLMVAALRSNLSVSFLGVKFHPQYVGKKLDEARALASVPDRAHVAITGNSSIALELVARGNLVFLDSRLDGIGDDYYGLVKEGLCGKASFSDYGLPMFWVVRDYQVLDKLDAVKERFVANDHNNDLILRKIYANFIGATTSLEDRCLNHIILYPSTFFSLSSKYNPFNLGDMELIKVYESLFQKRVLPLSQCYQYQDATECSTVTAYWFITKKIEWNGFNIGQAGLDVLEKYITSLPASDKKLIGWVEGKFFDILCRLADPSRMMKFLKVARVLNVNRLSVNKKIAFVRYADRYGTDDDSLSQSYDWRRDDSLAGLGRLKIAVQANKRELLPELINGSYRDIESAYLELAQRSLGNEYNRHVLPFFQGRKNSLKFLDVKYNDLQKNELLGLIEDRLRSQKPFSLVRLSDGEGYLFINDSDPLRFSIADARNRERHWWGGELPQDVRARVIEAGRAAVCSADVLGVPTIYRFLRDTSSNTSSFASSLQARGLLSVLNGLRALELGDPSITDDKVNTAIFTDRAVIERLFSAAKKVIIVSSALPHALKEFSGHYADIEFINIPTHNKQIGNEKFNSHLMPLPYQFETFYDQLLDRVKPGTLCLVGAGVAGKSFVRATKLAGGCGIDIGSAIDELSDAGIHSLH